ncbi:DUF4752 domain-containing protein [Salmonella enterica subsp. enterica serovar Newport]|nr:DUF4752 domain-containing protein [Salmonella enterica]EEN3488298.1 DUF4752 domain-containing protein [Salmonella enterica subsp. enterica serovar Newport]EAT9460733.1 DUF4752 domain-containing protein [Salmonella enterica]EAX2008054.1 DUF4752 domain-containing protein [Salmonella enterica]ECO2276486.1 DUF4752 domain-containing protein [Salmonella enterica]
MKQMTLIEMDGFLKGKCIPSDLKVNETNAEYLVRKFGELESKLETALRECRSAGITIDNLEAKCAALAAESAGMKKFCKDAAFDADYEAELGMDRGGFSDALNEIKTPATDAFLAEVRASARNEGINYAASRLAAAFNHGFLDKPVSEVLDVTRMILSAKEDLSNDPLPAADGLSGEYAEKSIEEWAAQLRKGVAQ